MTWNVSGARGVVSEVLRVDGLCRRYLALCPADATRSVPDALNQITGTWTTSGPQYGGLNGLQLVQTAIPEPSSLLLLLLGVVGLGLSRGNRRRG